MNLLTTEAHALLVMDLQNDVVAADGVFGRHGTHTRAAAPGGALDRTTRLLQAYRAAGRPVIHVAVRFRPGHPDSDPAIPLSRACRDEDALVEGSWGADFLDGFGPVSGELVVVKRGMSALAGTDLDLLLRLQGVRTLVLVGIASNLVVEATARQAVDLGYHVVFPEDASLGQTDEAHAATASALRAFAEVTTVDEVVATVAASPTSVDGAGR